VLSCVLIASAKLCSTMEINSLATNQINVFVSSYNGIVSSLTLTHLEGTSWSLQKTEESRDCGLNPSWLTFDSSRRRLYCLNEGINQSTGSVTVLSVTNLGSFSTVANKTLLAGPVNGLLSSQGNSSALYIAHYRYIFIHIAVCNY
jgi:6-phosphogluconolactonase (cycloisomerase 2 family)